MCPSLLNSKFLSWYKHKHHSELTYQDHNQTAEEVFLLEQPSPGSNTWTTPGSNTLEHPNAPLPEQPRTESGHPDNSRPLPWP